MNSLRVLESRRNKLSAALTVALLSATVFNHSAQAQGLVEGAGATGVAGSASQGAAGMGNGLGNLFGGAGNAVGAPNTQQSNAAPAQAAPSPNTATAASATNATLVYPLAGLAKRDAELIVAAYKGDTPAVRRALSQGANVDVRDRVYTWTPLMWASQNGHLGSVRYLLQKGANVHANSNDPRRFILLRYNEQKWDGISGDYYFVRWRRDGIWAFNGSITPLMLASAGGYAQTMRELLARGARVHTKAVSGETALMCAAASNYLPAVQLLLDRGAKVNEYDSSGASPLMYAVMAVNRPITRALLAKGADATITQNGISLEAIASYLGQVDPEGKPLATMLRSAAARQKRIAKRTSGETPVRRQNVSTAEGRQFPKATDAKPFDDGVMILR